jgi:uncharacterized lipoprotein YajG
VLAVAGERVTHILLSVHSTLAVCTACSANRLIFIHSSSTVTLLLAQVLQLISPSREFITGIYGCFSVHIQMV